MLSSNALSFIATIGTTIGVIGGVCGIVPLLKSKKINEGGILTTVNTIGSDVKKLADDLKPFLPAKITTAIDIIEKWGPIAAGHAQQLWHAGDISADDRAQTAEDIVINALKEEGFDVDDNRKALINAAIKNAVDKLGHTDPDVKQLQSTIDQQKSQLEQAQQQNTQLKQTIDTITTTAQAVQNTSGNVEAPSTEQTAPGA